MEFWIAVVMCLLLAYAYKDKSEDFDSVRAELRKIYEKIGDITSYKTQKLQEVDKICSRKIAEADKACAKRLDDTNRQINIELCKLRQQQEIVEKFIRSKIAAFPEVATVIANAETANDEMRAKQLETKKRPAIKGAEEVRAVKREKQELIKKIKALEWEMKYIRRLLPWIDEIEDAPMEPVNFIEDYVNPDYNAEGATGEDIDNAGYWLTPQEYASLSTTEKNQLALDRYNRRHKTNAEIGRDYERYVGYLFEKKGFKVDYTGIRDGMNDLDRDLICVLGDKTYVVQCKCWSNRQGKMIREKHINQIYVTAFKYYLEQRRKHRADYFEFGHSDNLFAHKIIPMFISTVHSQILRLNLSKNLELNFLNSLLIIPILS